MTERKVIRYKKREIDLIEDMIKGEHSYSEIAAEVNKQIWNGDAIRSDKAIINFVGQRKKRLAVNSGSVISSSEVRVLAKELNTAVVNLLKGADNILKENKDLKKMLRDLKDVRQAVEKFQSSFNGKMA